MSNKKSTPTIKHLYSITGPDGKDIPVGFKRITLELINQVEACYKVQDPELKKKNLLSEYGLLLAPYLENIVKEADGKPVDNETAIFAALSKAIADKAITFEQVQKIRESNEIAVKDKAEAARQTVKIFSVCAEGDERFTDLEFLSTCDYLTIEECVRRFLSRLGMS